MLQRSKLKLFVLLFIVLCSALLLFNLWTLNFIQRRKPDFVENIKLSKFKIENNLDFTGEITPNLLVTKNHIDNFKVIRWQTLQLDRKHTANQMNEQISSEKIFKDTTPKIFWAAALMRKLDHGFQSDQRCKQFYQKVTATKIQNLTAGTWNKCGRSGNGYANFSDTKVCIRYRYPNDYLILGEILSFALAKYLGIRVPCVYPSRLSDISDNNTILLSWNQNAIVAIVQWIDELTVNTVTIPDQIFKAILTNETIFLKDVKSASISTSLNILQIGIMITFDFIIGHHDRFARLQDESEKQHSLNILQSPIPNIGLDQNGHFWLFDNEVGFLDAYELMYDKSGKDATRFLNFHQKNLKILCIVPKRILTAITRLYQKTDPIDYLVKFVERNFNMQIPPSYLNDFRMEKFVRPHFHERLAAVIAHAKWCAERDY